MEQHHRSQEQGSETQQWLQFRFDRGADWRAKLRKTDPVSSDEWMASIAQSWDKALSETQNPIVSVRLSFDDSRVSSMECMSAHLYTCGVMAVGPIQMQCAPL